jgi:hypothetical protein
MSPIKPYPRNIPIDPEVPITKGPIFGRPYNPGRLPPPSGGGLAPGYLPGEGIHSGTCFIASTPVVMANGRTKPIGSIHIGDMVLSRDETTGCIAAQIVEKVFVHRTKGSLIVRYANGQTLDTTDEHRFYIVGRGFIPGAQLSVGMDGLTKDDRRVRIVSLEHPEKRSHTVYNIRVSHFHTYFVGKTGIWVHNEKSHHPGGISE